MTERKAITPAMKISCLLYRWFTPCSLCGKRIEPEDKVEWDHIHALVHDGPHEYQNLRPVHHECHKAKSAQDVKANAKVKRLRGETCQGPKKKIPQRKDPWPEGRKMQSRPFQKRNVA